MTDSTNLFATSDAWYPSGGPYFWQALGVPLLPPWVTPNYVSSGFMFYRNNARTREFIDGVLTGLRSSTTLLDGGADSTVGPDADQPILNAVLDALRTSDPGGSHTVPSTVLAGRPGCANYGPLSFLVLSPHLFQSAVQTQDLHLTRGMREPPYVRHFNALPAGAAPAAGERGGALAAKVASMKTWGAWSLDMDTEAVLMCRGMAGVGTAAAGGGAGSAAHAAK